MGGDWGMMGGIGEGLQAGVESYMKMRTIQEDKRQRDLNQALQAKLAGVQLNKAGTGWDDTAEGKEKSRIGMLKLGSEAQEYDPNNAHAGLLRNIAIQQVKTAHPDYGEDRVNELVPQGLSAAQYKEAAGLLKPELGGYYGLQGKQAIADAMKGRTEVARGGLDLRRGQMAQGINKQVNSDKVVQSTDQQQAAIAKGLDRLSSSQPMTPQMFNEVQMDLANAITGGRVAAQGTIHRVEMENMASKIAQIQQKLSSSPTDINAPEMKKYLQQTFGELKNLNQRIREKRVKTLTQQASQAFGSEGPFGSVIENLNQGATGEEQIVNPMSPQDEAAISWAKANPKDPRAAQILQMHGAK